MGERIMRVGHELGEGRIPRPVCLADEYALSIVIMNTDPPSAGDVLDMYRGLNHRDPQDWDDDEESVWDWRDQMLSALLPPEEANDYRRHDLLIMEAHGQGIYDTAHPRHPLRWFDRDDLRERCESSLAYVRLSGKEQDALTTKALKRVSSSMKPKPREKPQAARTAFMTSSQVPTQSRHLRDEIEQTRTGLGDTVQALAAKTDVKTRARQALSGTGGRIRQQLAAAKGKTGQAASTVKGRAVEASRNPTVRRALPPTAIAAAVAAVIGTAVVVTRRRQAAARRARLRPTSWLRLHR
ncbi:DUF3618 domain-containing protein [Actinoplanes regularis]|nr:DUF3618 domain-containing protein [Actinoplanes regularis]